MNMNDGLRAAAAPGQAELARRALKVLAERRLIPTPDSFAEVYHEVAGTRVEGASSAAAMKEVLKDLLRQHRLVAAEATTILHRVQQHDWGGVREGLERALARPAAGSGPVAEWPRTVLALIEALDHTHAAWPRGRKVEAVQRVVEASPGKPELVMERLSHLVQTWAHAHSADGTDPAAAPAADAPTPADAPSPAAADMPHLLVEVPGMARAAVEAPVAGSPRPRHEASDEAAKWKEIALRALATLEASFDTSAAQRQKIAALVQAARAAEDAAALAALEISSGPLWTAVEVQLDEDRKVRYGLQRLLQMLCENASGGDDAWLSLQMEPIRTLLSGPIRPRAIDQVEATVLNLLQQQAAPRKSLAGTKEALRQILHTLVDRVAVVGSTTGRYYETVGGFIEQLEQAEDIESITRVVDSLLSETRAVRDDIGQSQQELQEARRQVESYETRVRTLEQELSQVATLVQKDHLTQTLNRRGFEEAFRMEHARATRYRTPLTMVLLDIDNFKSINDTLGHIAGDRALVHVSTMLQSTLRPTDALARIGGEEFVLLLPATDVPASTSAVVRLQRELGARPFQHETAQRTITFSAGVAAVHDETLEQVLARADAAMYVAKRSGKNRAVVADGDGPPEAEASAA